MGGVTGRELTQVEVRSILVRGIENDGSVLSFHSDGPSVRV